MPTTSLPYSIKKGIAIIRKRHCKYGAPWKKELRRFYFFSWNRFLKKQLKKIVSFPVYQGMYLIFSPSNWLRLTNKKTTCYENINILSVLSSDQAITYMRDIGRVLDKYHLVNIAGWRKSNMYPKNIDNWVIYLKKQMVEVWLPTSMVQNYFDKGV